MAQPPILVGSTDKCFDHLRANYDVRALYDTIAEFCGVSTISVSRWFNGGDRQRGHATIGLRCFLSLFGYGVKEFTDLGETRRKLAFLIAYGVLTPQQMQKHFGYAQVSQLWSLLNGSQNLGRDKENKARALLSTHARILANVERDKWAAYFREKAVRTTGVRAIQKATVTPAPDPTAIDRNDAAMAFAASVEATRLFAELCLSADMALRVAKRTRDGATLEELADRLYDILKVIDAATPNSTQQ